MMARERRDLPALSAPLRRLHGLNTAELECSSTGVCIDSMGLGAVIVP